MDIFTRRIPIKFLRAPGWLRAVCLAAVVTTPAATFAANEPSLITGQKKSFGYSWQQELKLGADADKEITEQMGLYDNPQVQSYVEAVGQRVLQQSNFNNPTAPEIYRNTKFTFRVMDSPVVNAFALPGGYVYVTRGLLTHVQNEAQLAVVLGHEIAHVAARHSSQQARRSQWTQLGVIAGAILGSKVLGERGADLAPTILNMGSQAAEMFLLRYSREAETESDTLGVNYAARAGYASDQSAHFFESLQRISAAEGKTLPTWKSSHPDPGDRANRVVAISNQIPAESRSNVGEQEFLRHIEGMVIGDDPREGFVRNNVFYHPALRFQVPVAASWKVDNQKAAVVMAEPNGRAMMGLRTAEGKSAREAAMQFSQKSKVQVVSSGDTMVNGLPTSVIIGQAATEQGNVGVWNAFFEMEGRVYSLLGYAPQAGFEQMRPTFETIAAGFSPLRDPSIAAVQPARVKLVRADRAGQFASFIPTSLPPELSAEQIAILNQVALNETIPAGRLLKIPDVAPPAPVAPLQAGFSSQSYPPVTGAVSPATQSAYPNTFPPSTAVPSQAPAYPNYPQDSANSPAASHAPRFPQTPNPTTPNPGGPTQSQPPSWPR